MNEDVMNDFIELDSKELLKINGGNPWIWVAIGYLIGEVADGIQDGLSAECPEEC